MINKDSDVVSIIFKKPDETQTLKHRNLENEATFTHVLFREFYN